MNGGTPTPSSSLVQRKARVFPPALVEEVDATIRERAPHQSGDRIDRQPKLVSYRLHFLE